MDNISIQNNNTNTNTNNADNNTNINSSNSNNIIEIREYIDSDGPEVTKIWISGLKQTVTSSWFIFRPLLNYMMNSLSIDVTSNDGDYGINGINIMKTWSNTYNEDRIIYVATCNGIICGSCCVKRGAGENIIASKNCTDYYIYRLSIDENKQKLGIGLKIMNSIEDWSIKNGAKKMCLYTINSIAAKFYMKLGYDYITFPAFYTKKL